MKLVDSFDRLVVTFTFAILAVAIAAAAFLLKGLLA